MCRYRVKDPKDSTSFRSATTSRLGTKQDFVLRSPSGKLVQIEHALTAVGSGQTSLGIKDWLLGEWNEKGKILIFVQSQDKCDSLFRDLLRHGYPCLSLHGAKDQTDRESTVSDFKSDVCNLLIATSITARGLDVKDLELVINFHVPNHYEDYVHRVGRTGRAGRKGCAMTFISEEDARYAPDLVKALELSEQGLEQAHGTGYGGSGFKFNEEEDEVRRAAKKAQAKEYGFEDDKSDSEDEDEGIRKAEGDISQQAALAQIAAITAASKANTASMQTTASAAQLLPNGGGSVSHPGVLGQALPGTASVFTGTGLPLGSNDGAARAAAIAAAMNLQHNLAKIQADAMPEHYEAELEINDWVCFSRVTLASGLLPALHSLDACEGLTRAILTGDAENRFYPGVGGMVPSLQVPTRESRGDRGDVPKTGWREETFAAALASQSALGYGLSLWSVAAAALRVNPLLVGETRY
ncbi:hypothetical protein ACLB2K_072459 [Fragaria x ananassa]